MNRHFRDARYYLGRAAAAAKHGVETELGPLRERVRKLRGEEPEPEPTGAEAVKAKVRDVRRKAEDEARHVVSSVRTKRGGQSS